ncbi:L,D-transpeptidase [Nocardioides marmotae]|uniref:L,D-transpeptidase n=1 Tax=Nocardioides marmotae TaxID=2663857 RepID=UPI0012B55B43|nr:Ig-like domain-containing protein [Nocardioides marmotae]MBC9732176.1 L,D-transpeptidase family protein [Nocardioides marmotae]MTB83297.1 L,D-transpeptidase family protein [Nocardioides marmotae]
MSERRARAHRGAALAATLVLTLPLAAACDGSGSSPGAAGAPRTQAAAGVGSEPTGSISANVSGRSRPVPVDKVVEVTASDATLDKVRLAPAGGPTEEAPAVTGRLSEDGTTWRAEDRLEPGVAYLLHARGEDGSGQPVRSTVRFRTVDLTLDEQTYPSVAPLDGETVGVGMPVVVNFDVPVTDRASIERHLKVDATPAQPGTWHWLSDTEVHYRPKKYWKPGTKVSVDVDVNSVPAGGGVYGQMSRSVDFTVGDAHVYRVDAQAHHMKVFSNGKLLRTLPVTTGKPGFTTRSGTKVIIEKFDVKRMNSETVGIAAGSSEAYDIDDVQWAMRVTYSGEFIHAAPWSVGSQGRANVSHGCTGLSTADAGWLYEMSRRGDVVEYVGTDRQMTLDNGYGDWNASWAEYKAGSALG